MNTKTYSTSVMGSFIPAQPWRGRVLSTYRRVINLIHPSDIILSIVDSTDLMTDYGVTAEDFQGLADSVFIGSEFLWDNKGIYFKDFQISFESAGLWSGLISGTGGALLEDQVEKIKRVFVSVAGEDGFSPVITGQSDNIYSRSAVKIINYQLKEALLSGEMIDLSRLVGLGIGFTPSGDDFITGVIFYENITGIKIVDRNCIELTLGKTTVGGRTLLKLAINNSFPAYLKKFSRILLTDKGTVEEAVREVLTHGSTSGSDALTGFLWAAEKFKKNMNLP